MLYIKQLCLIIYIIITVLFTVGYASQPILETSQMAQTPTNADGTQSSTIGTISTVSSSFYIGKVSNVISNIQNTYSSSNDYSSVSNNLNVLFQTLLYTCIAITILLVVGILLGYFGLKMISKLIFLLAMILMIGVFIVIQVVILTDSFISKIKANGLNRNSISSTSTSTSNGTGYYLILASTVLMIITYVIYVFLA
jgi:ABC-type glycerol-3-phosphate transport system permease component